MRGMTTTDDTLRQIIDAIEAGPLMIKPGRGFVVTLYMPWGAAVGMISPAWYFDQKVAGALRVFDAPDVEHLADLGEKINPKRGETAAHASDEYVHLVGTVLCHVNGVIYEHRALRVRLADVTAWTFGEGRRNLR
jgi:hypothetical protein